MSRKQSSERPEATYDYFYCNRVCRGDESIQIKRQQLSDEIQKVKKAYESKMSDDPAKKKIKVEKDESSDRHLVLIKSRVLEYIAYLREIGVSSFNDKASKVFEELYGVPIGKSTIQYWRKIEHSIRIAFEETEHKFRFVNKTTSVKKKRSLVEVQAAKGMNSLSHTQPVSETTTLDQQEAKIKNLLTDLTTSYKTALKQKEKELTSTMKNHEVKEDTMRKSHAEEKNKLEDDFKKLQQDCENMKHSNEQLREEKKFRKQC